MNEPPDRGPSVLVVEDDACVAFIYRKKLESEGYRVEVCADGEAALRALSEREFDALVLDLMMPKVDGIQVLKDMRISSMNRLTPVIIVTAARLKLVEVEARRLGARFYLDKTETEKLLPSLREVLAEKTSLDGKLRMAPLSPLQNRQPKSREDKPAGPSAAAQSAEVRGLVRFFRRKDPDP
jgi:DNA-binding response OmpR family regulator